MTTTIIPNSIGQSGCNKSCFRFESRLTQVSDIGVSANHRSRTPVPPVQFDYTGNISQSLWQPVPDTKAYKTEVWVKVQIVLQDTSIVSGENHLIHIYGYDFYIIGEGFGNSDPNIDPNNFNLVDPPRWNTVGVLVNGWSVIRFVGNNPGVWLVHRHLDVHITWGLAMAFLVENGVGELESLQPPPADLTPC